MWVLGIEPASPERAFSALNHSSHSDTQTLSPFLPSNPLCSCCLSRQPLFGHYSWPGTLSIFLVCKSPFALMLWGIPGYLILLSPSFPKSASFFCLIPVERWVSAGHVRGTWNSMSLFMWLQSPEPPAAGAEQVSTRGPLQFSRDMLRLLVILHAVSSPELCGQEVN